MNSSTTISPYKSSQFTRPLNYNRTRNVAQKVNRSSASINGNNNINNNNINNNNSINNNNNNDIGNDVDNDINVNDTNANDNNIINNSETNFFGKLKKMFSSRSSQDIELKHNTKLKNNNNNDDNNNNNSNDFEQTEMSKMAQFSGFPQIPNHNIEWQPVYKEKCKIKLPVENKNTKVSIPQNVLDEWKHNQNQFSKGLNISKTISNQVNEPTLSQSSFLGNNCLSECCTNEENTGEPYSKFKCYYNYYLVDEYLESLVESQNKELDATGLDEEGQLYNSVKLNVKPIITTKQRLENGIPYDPKNLLQ